jgi:hypothetical protein
MKQRLKNDKKQYFCSKQRLQYAFTKEKNTINNKKLGLQCCQVSLSALDRTLGVLERTWVFMATAA